MTKYLIPRSDSVSVKIIAPSEFEKYFSSDLVPDYKYSGYTLSGGTGLTVNITSGTVRLKGFVIESTASETVSGLTANDVNYIYVKLARDSNSEAESWDFDKNLSGTAPTDAFYIGTATTNGTTVTSVNQADVITLAIPQFEHMYYGDGTDGDVTLSTNTSIGELKKYNNLTINSGVTLTSSVTEHASLMIKVKETLTINGTIDMDGKGARGSDGAAQSEGGAGISDHNASPNPNPGNPAVIAPDNVNWGWKDTGHTPLGTGTASGAGGGDGSGVPGLKPAPANVRVLAGDKFYVATAMPYMYGAAGTGGNSGSSGGSGHRPQTNATGSSGGGGVGGQGGAGGNGGGGIIIMAKNIVFNASGVITADGADGVDGAQGGAGGAHGGGANNNYGYRGNGGHGGGGGEGGQIILLYNYITNNGTITVTAGGAGGAGAAAPESGQGGSSAGSAGVAGSAGASKLIGLGS